MICNHRFDRTLGGHAMEILMRDHLIKLFKVIYDRIGRDWMINTIICDIKPLSLKLEFHLLHNHVMNM